MTVFDGGSGEPTILHLVSRLIDPLFSTLAAIILTGVSIYHKDEKRKRNVRREIKSKGTGWQRKQEPRQYITPSTVRRGRPAKIAITRAESNEIKLHYLACHGAINHTPFSPFSLRRVPPPLLHLHPFLHPFRPLIVRSFRIYLSIPVYAARTYIHVYYVSLAVRA